eukprot:CAMPEP_0197672162 /NCGR_PEP_ID=MMETSP1338-20131121/78239_1 /TAXON_ID=43686 ORGANISM="Pelagodinium beii, Strain RCC1491" /NCGR_SAMPLE_ID=MMETSP1338 /ASSEMBLY_ACC=CAM_ASM_000754 /LENGTH=246 /DNA_ID=CAMNT_0043252191 /DNA_START=22 /DNA_END=759 /DNA_ORIENTATION=-
MGSTVGTESTGPTQPPYAAVGSGYSPSGPPFDTQSTCYRFFAVLGCMMTVLLVFVGVTLGFTNVRSTSTEREQVVSRVAHTAPPSAETDGILVPYNCDDRNEFWSDAKHDWCCRWHQLGCPPTTEEVTTTSSSSLKYMWISVPVKQKSKPYDCAAGFSNWQKGWSHGKIAWCCENEGVACGPSQTDIVFDCDAGYSNWEKGWSPRKKLWCCVHHGKACPEQASEPFDCDAGYGNWHHGWSSPKKAW